MLKKLERTSSTLNDNTTMTITKGKDDGKNQKTPGNVEMQEMYEESY